MIFYEKIFSRKQKLWFQASGRPLQIARKSEIQLGLARPNPARPGLACLISQQAFGQLEPNNLELWAKVLFLRRPWGGPARNFLSMLVNLT